MDVVNVANEKKATDMEDGQRSKARNAQAARERRQSEFYLQQGERLAHMGSWSLMPDGTPHEQRNNKGRRPHCCLLFGFSKWHGIRFSRLSIPCPDRDSDFGLISVQCIAARGTSLG
jgi:hypothetical protein